MSELFFVNRLDPDHQGWAPDLRFAHPFLREPVVGADAIRESLRALADALGRPATAYLEFRGASGAAVAWKCGAIHGVTLAVPNDAGQIAELRIALRPALFLEAWRTRLLPWLARHGGGWEPPPLPDAADDGEQTDFQLPFPLSDNVQFHSPALVRPVQGVAAVSHVIAHAKAAYGDAEYGPALLNGNAFLRAYSARQTQLEIVSIAQLDRHERVRDLEVFMQPWPSLVLFRHRLRARLGDYLDTTYYEAS
jgi:hypothetical protein